MLRTIIQHSLSKTNLSLFFYFFLLLFYIFPIFSYYYSYIIYYFLFILHYYSFFRFLTPQTDGAKIFCKVTVSR